MLIALIVSAHAVCAMKALEKKQKEIAQAPQKRRQKELIKKEPVPYDGYRRLFMIFSWDEEKMPENALKDLQTQGIADIFPSFTAILAYALAQTAAPILVNDAYVLENLFLMKYGTQKYIAMAYGPDALQYNVWRTQNNLMHHEIINNTINNKYLNAVPEDSEFFKQYKKYYPPYEEPEGQEEMSETTGIPERFPPDQVQKDFFLYEYHGSSSARAYLLIPRKNASSSADALKTQGFNPVVFKAKEVSQLENEIEGSLDYSAYVKSGKGYTIDEFSRNTVALVNDSLTDDAKKPWTAFIGGHGQSEKSGEADPYDKEIAGIGAEYFATGLLPVMVDKNSRFCYIMTCSIGGTNRDLIRKLFPKIYVNDAMPKLAREILKRQTLKYPNNLITVLGGISDVWINELDPSPMPTDSIALFNKVWARVDKKPHSLDMRFMPFIQTVRYDRFFDELEKHLNAESAQGQSGKAALVPWKKLLEHVTTYDVAKDKYFYNNIPQIRFPGHDAPFNIVDIDERIQVLSYVGVKTRELEAKRGAASIDVKDKDMLLVYPLSVNVPIYITGTYPSIVPARTDASGFFFKKIVCPAGKDLQNAVHALFTFEATEGIRTRHDFLIEELQIGDTLYKNVLVENEPTQEEEAYPASADNGSEEGTGDGSEAGSGEPYYNHFVRTTVYYRTAANQLMMYTYDHKAKKKNLAVPETSITDSVQIEYVDRNVSVLKKAVYGQ